MSTDPTKSETAITKTDTQSFEDADVSKFPSIDIVLDRAKLQPQEDANIFQFIVTRAYTVLAGGTAVTGLAVPAGLATIDSSADAALLLTLTSLIPITAYLIFLAISLFAVRFGRVHTITEPKFVQRNIGGLEPARAKIRLLGFLNKASEKNNDLILARRKWLKAQLIALIVVVIFALAWALTVASLSAIGESNVTQIQVEPTPVVLDPQ